MVEADDRLIRALYDEHGAALQAYALGMTNGDLGRAQDAVQEVLVRAWRHPEALDPGRGSIRGWLLRTLRNVLIDEWRARSVRPETITDTLPDLGISDGVDMALQSWLVAEAVDRLSEAHRDVIRECFFNGRSVAEAAERLGVPAGTVKSRTHYALRALRVELVEMGVAP
ncbi:sigma-70 family RNA polymerase sigma factor [Pseudonocardia acaciae]|uniref:sigma-70 family RNA polymerase sigma factor n=1 Tax=Pseudonocardia acaciae TaxID=551276 RepID=UPI0004905AC7